MDIPDIYEADFRAQLFAEVTGTFRFFAIHSQSYHLPGKEASGDRSRILEVQTTQL